jgi:microcystin-dependent protein
MKRLIYSITFLALAACWIPQGAIAQASDPYVGEIQTFAFNFCPTGWARANGALMSISENATLFNLIGTSFGGDGMTTFALPAWGPIYTANGGTLLACISLFGVYPSAN